MLCFDDVNNLIKNVTAATLFDKISAHSEEFILLNAHLHSNKNNTDLSHTTPSSRIPFNRKSLHPFIEFKSALPVL